MSEDININDLPNEILLQIFACVCVSDLVCHVVKVCRRWQYVVEDPRLWRRVVYPPSPYIEFVNEVMPVLWNAPPFTFLVRPTNTSKTVLQTVCTHCKYITAFDVYAYYETKENFERFVSVCQDLEELTLNDPSFGASDTLQVVSKCLKLERLILVGQVSRVNRNIFLEISDGCPSLVSIDITRLKDYNPDDLEYLLNKKGGRITSLSLDCERADFFYVEGKGCLLPLVFKNCPNLVSLDVKGHCGKGILEELTPLVKLHLKSLCMTEFRHSNVMDVLKYFENGAVQKLIKLDLARFRPFNKSLPILIFEKCINVKHLNLEVWEGLTDDCLEHISNLKYLEYVNLDHCSKITDIGVEYIIKCRYLKYLVMNNSPLVTTKGFALCCENLRMLRELLMENCVVNSEDLIRVPEKLTYLKKLRAFWARMEKSAILALLKKVEKVDLGNVDNTNPNYRSCPYHDDHDD